MILFVKVQSTYESVWNQTKLKADFCSVTKDLNDLGEIFQPLWISVSSDKKEYSCPVCLPPKDSMHSQRNSKTI